MLPEPHCLILVYFLCIYHKLSLRIIVARHQILGNSDLTFTYYIVT